MASMASTVKKVVVVGDSGCGKSSLLGVFMTNKDLDVNTPTKIEDEVVTVRFKGKEVPLSLWSTAGEEVWPGFKAVMYEVKCACLHASLQVWKRMTQSANIYIVVLM